MKIESNKMVSLTYELRENDQHGKIIEVVEEARPLNFIYGTGKLLPSFETNLNKLSKGDPFSFRLSAEEGYGERREEMIIDVPISVFQNEGKVDESICYIGNVVPMMDTAGNPLSGIINEITDQHVKMDFNHPMAGVNLHFSGQVIDVREPSPEELNPSNNSCSGCHQGGDPSCSCGS
jgi:FKBP-type peptidyl-prolyl cis-trans isomerase SlyD